MEEQYALKIMINKILPGVVHLYNFTATNKWHVPTITQEEARKQLKKANIEHFINGQQIIYSIRLPGTTIEFKIVKLNHGRKHDENKDTIVFEVGFYDFTNINYGNLDWNMYDVTRLASGKYDNDPTL